jgi:Flp pilus assembly protein TadG
VETVLFLPMFLLALFGVMWTAQAAVQYERTQSAVRYAGLIAQSDSPYADYSLYSMYTQLPATTLPTLTCNMPQAVLDTLSDASPTYSSAQTVTASPPFWAGANPSDVCPTPGLVGIPAGTGLAQDVLLTERIPSGHLDHQRPLGAEECAWRVDIVVHGERILFQDRGREHDRRMLLQS